MEHDEVVKASMADESQDNIAMSNSLKAINSNLDVFVTTGEQLINMKQQKLSYLIDGLFPRTGATALVGSSDAGKSSLLRQLAMSIVYKEPDFIGFPILAKHNRVVYVSTEDDSYALAYLLGKQMPKDKKPEDLEGLLFIFDSEDLLKKLDKVLREKSVDCVIIDTFTDIYSGDMIATNKVRSYLNDFVNLSKKYDCLFVFLHHTGKRTESFLPSKDNILGSQGFEAKMRLVVELRRDFANDHHRHLCIVKGNYIPSKDKSQSYVLTFDDDMRYSNTGKRVDFNLLVKPEPKRKENSDAKVKAIELRKQGLSVTEIQEEMSQNGFSYGRSTIGNWVKDCPSIQTPIEKKIDGQLEGEDELSIHPED